VQTKEIITLEQSQNSEVSLSTAMIQLITGTWVSQAIYVAAYFGIADLLKDGAKSVDELAQVTGTSASKLYRVLRALASIGVFSEVEPRQFALTASAHYLRSDIPDSLRGLSMVLGDEWSWRSWGEIVHIVETEQLPLQRLYQVDNAYEYFAQNPMSGTLFSDAMTNFTRNTIIPVVLDAYDFSGIDKIVDIGGSHGPLIAAILALYPQMRGVLFELPQVVEGASSLLSKAGVSNRCEIVGGDFFESVPSGGDAYILSQILHGFDDEHCIKLLKNIRQGITETGKLLVVQAVIPAGNESCFNKFLDLELMILDTGARERTEAEYHHILQAAGFELRRIVPTAGPVNVIEGVCA
jgi:hypothetical protein